jgi:putative ABC transport system permease protein
VIDDIYAAAKGVQVGDEVGLLNQKFTVSGIVEHGKGARLFMSLKAAQEMVGSIGRVSLFFIKLNNPDEIPAVIERLEALLPTYPVRNLPEYASLMTSQNIPGLDAFIRTVVFVAVCIGILVIFLSMYTTITERTREIGILRSLGASKVFILKLILQESVLLCTTGVVVGFAISFIVSRAVQWKYPTLIVLITPMWMWRAALFAILGGIVGSLYPAVKAAKQDPIEALAYE